MSNSVLARVRAIIAIVAAILLAAACGGGGGSGGVVESGGVGSGVITGFGSLIVDGMHYDDSTASYMSEQGQGPALAMPITGTTVGQRVEFSYGAGGNMMSALISPELVGAVTALGPNSMTVLGTSVMINDDATRGPVTRFVGYASSSDINIGDRVEVHGLFKTDSKGVVSLQATLVVQTPTATGARLTGYVTQYNATAGSFAIGSIEIRIGTATIVPAGAVLANGALVTVWSNADPAGNTMSANTIRIKLAAGASQNMKVSGVISSFASTASFQIGNLIVDASKAIVAPSGTTLAAGQYVLVVGTFETGGNKLSASNVTVFTAAAPSTVELHGTVANFVSASSFTVRGVVVDASTAIFANGTAAQLANGVFVEVRGAIANNVVRATTVSIRSLTPLQAPAGSIVDMNGVIVSYNAATGSYTMTLESGATVSGILMPSMFYNNGNAANLTPGQSVTVTGMLTGGMLSTSVMSFSPGNGASATNRIHMEGIAYNVTPATFMLNGLQIQINGVPIRAMGMMSGHSMMSGSRVSVDVQLLNGQYMAMAISLFDVR